jgi:hypothetical protein
MGTYNSRREKWALLVYVLAFTQFVVTGIVRHHVTQSVIDGVLTVGILAFGSVFLRRLFFDKQTTNSDRDEGPASL